MESRMNLAARCQYGKLFDITPLRGQDTFRA
jgi:hypothetical protein